MLIQNIINKYSELKLIFYKKSLNLEIIEISDLNDTLYEQKLLYISLGQLQFRNLLNELYGNTYNPYCYIQNDIDGNLTLRSIYSWYLFSGCKKMAAFQDGKLIAMRVMTIYSSKKMKNKNILFDKKIKTWLHNDCDKTRYNGINLNIFNRKIEFLN